MSHLMYNNAQDILMTRADMRGLRLPEPRGPRHQPYGFATFADTVCDKIEESGFAIQKEEFAVTKDGGRFFGLLQVAKPNGLAGDSWRPLVALRGAHDQRISRGIAIGSQVMVCSNLCFHGDLGNWKTKQTSNIGERMPNLIGDAVSGLQTAARRLQVSFDKFRDSKISRDEGDSILLDIFRSKGGFSASQLGRAIQDWDSCSVPEHTVDGRNLWWLFNSCTHALKPTGNNINHDELRRRSDVVFHKLTAAPSFQASAPVALVH